MQLTDELQQAQGRMARCQAAIKNAVRVCEEAQGDTAIAADLFDSDGELDETHIFCARCRGRDSHDDNDIILCDGPCNRAYHECCLSPRIRAGELPEDEGWLCPACDAKVRCLGQGQGQGWGPGPWAPLGATSVEPGAGSMG